MLSNVGKRIADSCGLTALHYAARRGDVEIVKLLMEYGADPMVTTDQGIDVLTYCDIRGPFPKVAAVLLGEEESEEEVEEVVVEEEEVVEKEEEEGNLMEGDL